MLPLNHSVSEVARIMLI